MIASIFLAALAPALQESELESRYYAVDYLTPPEGEVLEVGGLAFLPDGRLIASTRRGQVWIVENPLAEDPADASFSLFAEGLWEGLGLAVMDGEIYVVQRTELSRLVDVDGDGKCDDVQTVCDQWGVIGNYHEFAYGLPVDEEGNFYVSLNVSFFNPLWWHGKSPAPWRGWLLRIAPDGSVTPVACGLRSPCGMGFDANGELFVTDNQGDWMPASPIFHIEEGGFYGHPASLDWTEEYRSTQTLASDTAPPARASRDRKPAAVWLPYKWSRSPGNLVPDLTGGRFGPFEEQLILAELTNGMLLRVQMEEVQGVQQGAVWPLRHDVGSAVRACFAPDGSLMVGFTNRGWGGLSPASGIGRVRWTGEVPFEMQSVNLRQDGFEIRFTRPLAAGVQLGPEHVSLIQYDYDYWWEYGSPERDPVNVDVTSVEVSADRLGALVHTTGLTAGRMARLVLSGATGEDGAPLLHPEFAYTINQLPGADRNYDHVAKIAPVPPARASEEEGWLRLTYGDATDLWQFEGWELVDAELDPAKPRRLRTTEGVGALTNTASRKPTDYVSELTFGSHAVHVEFMLPEGGRSGVRILGAHEILLVDSRLDQTEGSVCAAVLAADGSELAAPLRNAYGGPGVWHELDAEFHAPRFDASGKKVADARLVNVRIDDIVMHEQVLLPGDLRSGPLVLVGTGSHVAFGNIRVKPIEDEPASTTAPREEWVALFDGEDLDDWSISDDGYWYVDDGGVIVGEGDTSHIFSPRGDYRDFELRAKVKISDGGNSGLYFRVAFGPGWPEGYEAKINSSFADPQKTGSLYDLAPVKTHLVSQDTWFDYRVLCRDEDQGTRVRIWVNGLLITDHLDTERRYTSGHIAIQQHHDGSVIEIKDLLIREL